METFNGVVDALTGFSLTLWLVLVLGVVTGLVVGVLPGLTFVMGILLILPFTYGMETDTSIVLLLAVYVAGTYGGAITSILLHIPGEPNNVPLLWDGYTMTRQGRAAEALGWAAVAAFVGGLAAWALLTFAAKPLADFALRFGQPDYFLIVLIGLTSVLALAGDAVVRALASLLIGMLLATVGVDDVYGDGPLRLRQQHPARRGRLPAGHGRHLRPRARAGPLRRELRRRRRQAAQQGAHRRCPGLRALRERAGSLRPRHRCSVRCAAWCRVPARRWRRSSPTASRSRPARTATRSARARRTA